MSKNKRKWHDATKVEMACTKRNLSNYSYWIRNKTDQLFAQYCAWTAVLCYWNYIFYQKTSLLKRICVTNYWTKDMLLINYLRIEDIISARFWTEYYPLAFPNKRFQYHTMTLLTQNWTKTDKGEATTLSVALFGVVALQAQTTGCMFYANNFIFLFLQKGNVDVVESTTLENYISFFQPL